MNTGWCSSLKNPGLLKSPQINNTSTRKKTPISILNPNSRSIIPKGNQICRSKHSTKLKTLGFELQLNKSNQQKSKQLITWYVSSNEESSENCKSKQYKGLTGVLKLRRGVPVNLKDLV